MLKKPLINVVNEHLTDYPTTINYTWSFGFLAGMCLLLRIVTGILLAAHYCHSNEAPFFFSVHYLFFVISGIAVAHVSVLHYNSPKNLLGCATTVCKIPFYPFYIVKGPFSPLVMPLVFSVFVFSLSSYLGVSVAILLVVPFACIAETRSVKFRYIARLTTRRVPSSPSYGLSYGVFVPVLSESVSLLAKHLVVLALYKISRPALCLLLRPAHFSTLAPTFRCARRR